MRNRIVAVIVVAVFCLAEALMLTTTADPLTNTVNVVDSYPAITVDTHEITPTVYVQRIKRFYSAIIDKEWIYIQAEAKSINAEKARQAEYSNTTIPSEWMATAICEESGRNDPNYGYFGIKEWQGFDGYPNAGSAPLSVQLAWEAKYIGGPPDAPGHCHSY